MIDHEGFDLFFGFASEELRSAREEAEREVERVLLQKQAELVSVIGVGSLYSTLG